jgi:5'-deoxynucleotidase YfbR-like HD superfamily hydrolase
MEERVGDWIEVYGGGKFYPLDPRPDEIKLRNIAHGLSMMCRFNGQCKRFFSVAQHSMNVAKEVASLTRDWERRKSVKAQLLALLHDASECLGISDICSPAKKYMPEYQAIEKKIQDTVWSAFNLEHTDEEYELIDLVDKAMAAYEARELMTCTHWDLSYSYLVQAEPESKSYIDLSVRDMKEIENNFHGMIFRLLLEFDPQSIYQKSV